MSTKAFLHLTQGQSSIWVSTDQIVYFCPNVDKGTFIAFPAVVRDEPAYIVVDEQPEEVAARIQKAFSA